MKNKGFQRLLTGVLAVAMVLAYCPMAMAGGTSSDETAEAAASSSATTTAAVKASSYVTTDENGYSLQVGGKGVTYAYFLRTDGNKDITNMTNKDRTSYSFDYRYPSDVTMDGYLIYSCFNYPYKNLDGSYGFTAAGFADPSLTQDGSTVKLRSGGITYDAVKNLAPDVWHNFTIVVQEKAAYLYVDGSPIEMGGSYAVKRSTDIPLRDIGVCGNVYAASWGPADPNKEEGYAFYDNLRYAINGKEVVNNDSTNGPLIGDVFNFNHNDSTKLIPSASNFYMSPEMGESKHSDGTPVTDAQKAHPDNTWGCHLSEKGMSYPVTKLDSLDVSLKDGVTLHAGEKVNVDDTFNISGKMSDGRSVVPGMGALTVTPDSDNFASTETANGKTYITFKKQTTDNLTFSLNMYGQSKEVTIPVTVAGRINVTSMNVSATKDTLFVGGSKIPLSFSLTYDNGNTVAMAPSSLEGLKVFSSDSSVASVTLDTVTDKYVVSGEKAGTATLYATYTPVGAMGALKATISFKVRVLSDAAAIMSGPTDETRGIFRIPLSDQTESALGDKYSVSFDYYPPSDKAMNRFIVFSSCTDDAWNKLINGYGYVATGATVSQTGTDISVQIGNQTFASDAVGTTGKWHHIVLCYDGSNFKMYMDGTKVKFNNSTYTLGFGSNLKIPSIGVCGDHEWREPSQSATAMSGYAYYDNFRIMSNGETVKSYDFNSADSDSDLKAWWLQPGGSAPAGQTQDPLFDHEMDREATTFDSLTYTLKQDRFMVGAKLALDQIADLSGKMNDGTIAAVEAGQFDVTSSDSNIISVSKDDNGEAVMTCNNVGSCSLTITAKLYGVIKSVTIPVSITNKLEIYKLIVGNGQNYVTAGGTLPLVLKAYMTDGSTRTLTADELKAISNIDVTSDNTDAVTVEKTATGFTLHGVAAGTANIKVIGDGLAESTNPIETVTLKSMTVSLLSTPVYVNDDTPVILNGTLSNGQAATTDDLASAEYTVSPESAGTFVEGNQGEKMFHAAATTTGAQVFVKVGSVTGATTKFNITPLEVYKTKATYYTAEKVANARENVKNIKWATLQKNEAVALANQYLSQNSLDDLWSMFSSQNIPRSYGVNQPLGSLATDDQVEGKSKNRKIDAYSNYPYKFDRDKIDWKLTDPTCRIQFPTNNFKAYYEGGLDANGNFSPALAKKHNDDLIAQGQPGNLVNLLSEQIQANPKIKLYLTDDQLKKYTSDPKWGVDDGYGYNYDPTRGDLGKPYTFVAYYAHYAVWYTDGVTQTALTALTNAYLYTGEQRYADAAIVMLDRVADLYPTMHVSQFPFYHGEYGGYGFLSSDGWGHATNMGRIVGSIWENELIKSIMKEFDAVYPAIATMSPEAKEYLTKKTGISNKADPNRIIKNFEDHVLREVYTSITSGDLAGNAGLPQSTIALAAVVMDHYPETQKWLDFDFGGDLTGWNGSGTDKGGGTLVGMVDNIDSNGQGNEAAPSYNSGWLGAFRVIADILQGYELPGGQPLSCGQDADLYKNAKFRHLYYGLYPMLLTDNYMANVGDAGQTGNATTSYIDLDNESRAYQIYRDPELARVIYLKNGNSSGGLSYDIFTKNPGSLETDVQKDIDTYGEMNLGSTLLAGSRFAALRDGEPSNYIAPKGYTYSFYELGAAELSDGILNDYWPGSNQTMQLNAKKTGDYVSYNFSFTGDVSKSYIMTLGTWVAPSYGNYDIYLNDNKIGIAVPFNVGSRSKNVEFRNIKLKPSNNIRFVCVSANYYTEDGSKKEALKMGVHHMTFSEPAQVTSSESKASTQRALWTSYFSVGGHAHADNLQLGMIAYDLDMMPDLGYPETADTAANRSQWVGGTISHNTVEVNGLKQSGASGKPVHFDDSYLVKVMENSSPASYADTSVYDRTSALIKINEQDSYVVDLFRVKGGTKQEYSFHTGESTEDPVVDGLDFDDIQNGGSYAGPNIPWGTTSGSAAEGGYTWLKNVKTATDGSFDKFSLDWTLKDTYARYSNGLSALTDTHMKWTMLGDYDQVSLADGIPPTNKPNNPASLQYAIVKNTTTGSSLSTNFTSVFEPYKKTSKIKSIDALDVYDNETGELADDMEARAVKVTLTTGRVDYIVNAMDKTKSYTVVENDEDKFTFSGFFGVYTEINGKPVFTYLNDGTEIAGVKQPVSAVTGTVADFSKGLVWDSTIDIKMDQDVDPQALVGHVIYVTNDGQKNADYTITSATKQDDGTVRLEINHSSLVRKWIQDTDFSKGFVYDIGIGQSYRIPLSSFGSNFPKTTMTASVGGDLIQGTTGYYAPDTLYFISASPRPGYQFSHWEVSGVKLANTKKQWTYFYTSTTDSSIKAVFEVTPAAPESFESGTNNSSHAHQTPTDAPVEVPDGYSVGLSIADQENGHTGLALPKDYNSDGSVQTRKDRSVIGWDAVTAAAGKLKANSKLEVDLHNDVQVPSDFFSKIKGKNILATMYGKNYDWKVNGKNIKTAADVDLSVATGTKSIPSSVIKKVAGSKSTTQFTTTHHGSLGFTGALNLNLGLANKGKNAKLYAYVNGKLVYKTSAKISSYGYAQFTMSEASGSYLVVIDPLAAKVTAAKKLTAGSNAAKALSSTNLTGAVANPQTGDSMKLSFFGL